MIQLLASTNCGSSMIMTDPKGELFDLHSKAHNSFLESCKSSSRSLTDVFFLF